MLKAKKNRLAADTRFFKTLTLYKSAALNSGVSVKLWSTTIIHSALLGSAEFAKTDVAYVFKKDEK
jgi:hypothetical protein